MSDDHENTPFLADNEHNDTYDETDSDVVKVSPANANFRVPLKILTSFSSVLSFLIFGLLIASYVFIITGQFQSTYDAQRTVRDLAICLFVNLILSAPTIFLQIPILINIAVNIAMSIVILFFSIKMFSEGWPTENFCRRWHYYAYDPHSPYRKPQLLPETWECTHGRTNVRIMMGVCAGVGIVIGLLILTKLLLRLTALARTKFWKGKKFGNPAGLGWKPSGFGFTVQFSFSIVPYDNQCSSSNKDTQAVASNTSGDGERLIET